MAYTIKTTKNENNVEIFLETVTDDEKKSDSKEVIEMMKKITGEKPQMWGKSIIGFVPYSYETKSKCSGEWFRLGFSPRKNALTFYVGYSVISDKKLREKLGKHTSGKACLYVKKLSDIDMTVLEEIFQISLQNEGCS